MVQVYSTQNVYDSAGVPGETPDKGGCSIIVTVLVAIVAIAIGIGAGIGIGYGIFHKSDKVSTPPTTEVPTRWLKETEQIRTALLPGGNLSGVFYNRLANFTDVIGNRLIGTDAFEKAVNMAVQLLTEEGFDSVHTETSTLRRGRWLRGEETLTLLTPRVKGLAVLGLGWTKPTDPAGIEADAIVFRSDTELTANCDKAKNKIVVFNPEWTGYGNFVKYRTFGATWAANCSAVAVLVRSAASKSAYNPHTGAQRNVGNLSVIPAAAITVEDAALLWRLQEMGETVRLNLTLQSDHTLTHDDGSPFLLRTVVAQLNGTERPDEIVLVSGHLDSWDVGEGAMDDGDGVFLSWMVLTTLKTLNLRPKRTIRAVFWAAEENGAYGSTQYYLDHHNSTQESHVFVMESDFGVFKPGGIGFSGTDEAAKVLNSTVLPYLAVLNCSTLVPSDGIGADVDVWLDSDGIPGAEPYHENMDEMTDYYFTYHHSNADMMTVLNSDDMDLASIMYTTVAFIVADLDERLPLAPPKRAN